MHQIVSQSPLAIALLALVLESEGFPSVWFTLSADACQCITMAPRPVVRAACDGLAYLYEVAS